MNQRTSLSRLAGSAVLFLILALVVFYITWQRHKVTSNTLSQTATVLGAFAGVLWAGQNTGPRLANWLDGMLLGLIPRKRWMLILGGLVGLALFFWAVWYAVSERSRPAEAPTSLPAYVWWSGFLIVFSVGVVGIQSSQELLAKLSADFGLGEQIQTSFVTLALILVLVFGSVKAGVEWALRFYMFYFLGVGLLRIMVSPISMSDSIKELAGGQSVTLAFVLVLCCISFVLLVVGLLI